MIYNFYTGKTAKRIEEIIKVEIQKTSTYFFEPITNISFNKIKYNDKRFFYKKGEDLYLMFAYMRRYYTETYGKFPVYHVCQCKTRTEYTGFTYAASMPVEVYCRNQNRLLEGLHQLRLCINCESASQKGIFSFLAKGKPWYEYVLQYANTNSKLAKKTQVNGYVRMWKQISEAVRERGGFRCEQCNINLKSKKYFLEVHHKDYNKTNNDIENLIALCVLCHATVDERHLNNFKEDGFKVNSFITSNEEFINKNNKLNLDKWNKY